MKRTLLLPDVRWVILLHYLLLFLAIEQCTNRSMPLLMTVREKWSGSGFFMIHFLIA